MSYTLLQAHTYISPSAAPYLENVLWPGEALDHEDSFQVYQQNIFHPDFPENALSADLLVINDSFQPQLLSLIKARRALNRPTVFSIHEDILVPGQMVSQDDIRRNPAIRANFFHHGLFAHGIEVPTRDLMLRYKFLNPKTAIFPYQLPQKPPPLVLRKGPFTFGLRASSRHDKDLAYLAPAIIAFCASHPDTHFHFMGNNKLFRHYFADIPKEQKTFTLDGSRDDWYDFLQKLTVAIIVHAPEDRSANLSDLQYLDSAANGAATLMSWSPVFAAHATDSVRARLFNGEEAFLKALHQMYADKEKTRDMSRASHAFAATRTHYAARKKRRDFYLDILGHAPPNGEELKIDTPLPHQFKTFNETLHTGKLVHILQGSSALLEAFPHYGFVHYQRLRNLVKNEKFSQAIHEYGLMTPDAMYHDHHYEQLHLATRAANPLHAQKYLEKIKEPNMRLRLEGPAHRTPVQFYRERLQTMPFEFEAVFQLAKQLGSRRRVGEEAEEMAMKALMLMPESTQVTELLEEIREKRAAPPRRKSRP